MINNEGLLNTCCPTKCELIYVYNFKVENRKYKGYETGFLFFKIYWHELLATIFR